MPPTNYMCQSPTAALIPEHARMQIEWPLIIIYYYARMHTRIRYIRMYSSLPVGRRSRLYS